MQALQLKSLYLTRRIIITCNILSKSVSLHILYKSNVAKSMGSATGGGQGGGHPQLLAGFV